MTLRVVVADDQDLVRAGFVALLSGTDGFTVVGEAGRGDDAVRAVRTTRPDVVLMDVRMPGGDGIGATRTITADPALGGVRVVILTTFGLDEYVFGALRAGAVGFLVKDTSPEELLRAVRVAADGDALLSPAITRRLVEAFAAAPPPVPQSTGPALTARERDVLVLVARGRSNADIARDLHIGVATVKSYVSRLLTKLDTTTRVGLVVHAYETGVVVPGGPV